MLKETVMSGTRPWRARLSTTASDPDRRLSPDVRSIALAGSKGGVGTTTIAVELASLGRAHGLAVALLDLVPRGDSHYRLDVPLPASRCPTIEDLVPLAEELDEKTLQSAMLRSADGIMLLTTPADRPADLEGLPRLVRSMSESFDLVIVDAGRRAGETEASFEACDSPVLVVTPDVIGVGDAGRLLEEVGDARFDRGKLSVIVNRCLRSDDLISVRDVESYLCAPVIAVLGEETALCRAAGDRGRFVHSERTKLSESLQKLYLGLLYPR